ncbi:MAG TPA: SemiSWEET transporter, partial [Chryseosolibacter sp.]
SDTGICQQLRAKSQKLFYRTAASPTPTHDQRAPPVAAQDFSAAATSCHVLNTQTEIVGLTAGICTSISLLPQLLKLLRHKKAEDISLFYLVILFIGLGLWIWYGILREDVPILVTNGFSLVINGIIIIFGVKYKKKTA